MYTDRRERVRVVEWVVKGSKPDGWTVVLAVVAMELFLGPLGWLLSSGNDKKSGQGKLTQRKSRLKVSRCHLCQASDPLKSSDSRGDLHGFEVHPRFAQAFEALNAVAAAGDLGET